MKQILLVGNPNVGKTMILNQLTNATFRIGNWAGVTVSRQEGYLEIDQEQFHILDLPGIYSLNPCSEDEHISINALLSGSYDLILNIIDIHNLHQNLMLTTELLELGCPMIAVLNFYDEFELLYHINIEKLTENLEIPVIPISAKTGKGLQILKNTLKKTDEYTQWIIPNKITTQENYQNFIKIFDQITPKHDPLPGSSFINPVFIYTLLSMKNSILLEKYGLTEQAISELLNTLSTPLPNFTTEVLAKKELLIYKNPITQITPNKHHLNYTKLTDSILLHPILGYLSCAVIMAMFFNIVFHIANPWIDFIDWIIASKIKHYTLWLLTDTLPALQSFIIDGLIGGVGSVLTFVPLIFTLYIFLSLLEESGYLARIAILLDYPFSKIGLSGKSLFPMLLGFGCTVPAIYGSRVLETKSQRHLTAILSSLISCGARLPVYALFIAAFFEHIPGLILLSLYLVGILLTIFLAFIISKISHFSALNPIFVLVLPKYRFPNFKVVIRTAQLHTSSYMKNAGGIILGMLMLIWVFSYFPSQGDINKSYLVKIGKFIQPVFIPLGFGDRWEPVVSIIPSLIAKESVVGFFGQVLSKEDIGISKISAPLSISQEIKEITTRFLNTISLSISGITTLKISPQTPTIKELEENAGLGIVQKLRQIWTDKHRGKKAYSFMIFILLTLPCVAAIGALHQELDTKSFVFAILLYTFLPFIGSLIYYQIAILF